MWSVLNRSLQTVWLLKKLIFCSKWHLWTQKYSIIYQIYSKICSTDFSEVLWYNRFIWALFWTKLTRLIFLLSSLCLLKWHWNMHQFKSLQRRKCCRGYRKKVIKTNYKFQLLSSECVFCNFCHLDYFLLLLL